MIKPDQGTELNCCRKQPRGLYFSGIRNFQEAVRVSEHEVTDGLNTTASIVTIELTKKLDVDYVRFVT